MKIKNIVILIVLCFKLFTLHAHILSDTDASKQSFKDRLRFFMGVGAQFGGQGSYFNLQPQLGYQIKPKWIAGLGLNWQYYQYSGAKTSIIGGNVFTRYAWHPKAYTQFEFQELNYFNKWHSYAMIGAGIIPSKGFYLSAYYLLLYPKDNIYRAPYIIRFGVFF